MHRSLRACTAYGPTCARTASFCAAFSASTAWAWACTCCSSPWCTGPCQRQEHPPGYSHALPPGVSQQLPRPALWHPSRQRLWSRPLLCETPPMLPQAFEYSASMQAHERSGRVHVLHDVMHRYMHATRYIPTVSEARSATRVAPQPSRPQFSPMMLPNQLAFHEIEITWWEMAALWHDTITGPFMLTCAHCICTLLLVHNLEPLMTCTPMTCTPMS